MHVKGDKQRSERNTTTACTAGAPRRLGKHDGVSGGRARGTSPRGDRCWKRAFTSTRARVFSSTFYVLAPRVHTRTCKTRRRATLVRRFGHYTYFGCGSWSNTHPGSIRRKSVMEREKEPVLVFRAYASIFSAPANPLSSRRHPAG